MHLTRSRTVFVRSSPSSFFDTRACEAMKKIVKYNKGKGRATHETHVSRQKGMKHRLNSRDDNHGSLMTEADSDIIALSRNGDSVEIGDDSGDFEEQPKLDGGHDEFEIHKRDLLALKEQDPEFYQYLQENDRELLEFSDDETNSEHVDASEEVQVDHAPILTMGKIRNMETVVKTTHSLGILKRLLVTLRLACHSNDEQDSQLEFSRLESDTVYRYIFSSIIHTVGRELAYHLNIQDLSHIKL
jgi:nucleolar complex protein 2